MAIHPIVVELILTCVLNEYAGADRIGDYYGETMRRRNAVVTFWNNQNGLYSAIYGDALGNLCQWDEIPGERAGWSAFLERVAGLVDAIGADEPDDSILWDMKLAEAGKFPPIFS